MPSSQEAYREPHRDARSRRRERDTGTGPDGLPARDSLGDGVWDQGESTMVNLLVSESLSVDPVLDRTATWTDDIDGSLVVSVWDEEPAEHPGCIASGQEPSWLDLRLSTVRRACSRAPHRASSLVDP